ncbi:probable inactive peptidyl-prolyl cis-trans isomerase-like 6 isoform X2 [Rhinatrema bivittatum]|uniref:probable inactive peptidyl-prolyl cis-trans isomerase-like 6 isoform X2 n=1 Tax=Rhinatrema bivittatum TaxID=194408 RepID=UPI00112D4C1A|nr:probable inactive peptidyl-prolyl cis-trans isomerase-like 6 isoform X2 [Rhinatrema bivittatum]
MRLRVVGFVKGVAFQTAKCAAEGLKQSFDTHFTDPSIQPLHEFDWNLFLAEKKKELKGEIWEYPSSVMCFINDQLLGDERIFLKWAYQNWAYTDFRPLPLYRALAEDFCIKYMKSSKHVFVYMDISIQENPIGRLLFELFSDICPKTCENFWKLCTGEAGTSRSGLELTYKGSVFHRIVRKGWIQGGDIKLGSGSGGESIYGSTFIDENFAVSHHKRGILAMANKGRHSMAHSFYITLQAAPYLDRKYVAFGELIEGTEILKELESVPTYNERPKISCVVVDCGVFKP